MERAHEVAIIGGGNAGVSLAARLKRYGVKDIALIEPKEHHLYQPLFSHIAGGRAEVKEAVRSQESVTPKGVAWIKDKAAKVDAKANSVTLASGSTVSYEHLVVCPGLQYNWDAVPGLAEAVHSPYGASHYEFELAPKLWTLLSSLTSGTVIFTMPAGPVKMRRGQPETYVPGLRLLEGAGSPGEHPGSHGPALSHSLRRPRGGR